MSRMADRRLNLFQTQQIYTIFIEQTIMHKYNDSLEQAVWAWNKSGSSAPF